MVFLVGTLHWPVISDARLIRYAVFLMHHGMAPYRDIKDVNMPGSYFSEDMVAFIFGKSALGWRFFDFTLLAATGVAMGAILKPYGRFAGLFAGACFALTHGADGVAEAGQRDLVIAALLVSGYACLFQSIQKNSWLWMAWFGFLCGCAATIKPQVALLFLGMLPIIFYACRKTRFPGLTWLGSCAVGFLLPIAAVLVFLIQKNALAAFLSNTRQLIAYHASIGRHTALFLVAHAIPIAILPLVLLAFWIAAARLRRPAWEECILLLGACFGFVSFCVQGRAYPYHRYPLMAFLWVLIAAQFSDALLSRGKICMLATAGLVYSVVWIAPAATAKSLRYDWRDQRALQQLRSDIDSFGGRSLANHVQCMDTTAGCLMVLDESGLEQATGFLYDCYFFSSDHKEIESRLREQFLQEITDHRPHVFIVTDQWCFDRPAGYGKLDQWPQFKQFLDANYSLGAQREWNGKRKKYLATPPFGYRIYSIKAP